MARLGVVLPGAGVALPSTTAPTASSVVEALGARAGAPAAGREGREPAVVQRRRSHSRSRDRRGPGASPHRDLAAAPRCEAPALRPNLSPLDAAVNGRSGGHPSTSPSTEIDVRRCSAAAAAEKLVLSGSATPLTGLVHGHRGIAIVDECPAGVPAPPAHTDRSRPCQTRRSTRSRTTPGDVDPGGLVLTEFVDKVPTSYLPEGGGVLDWSVTPMPAADRVERFLGHLSNGTRFEIPTGEFATMSTDAFNIWWRLYVPLADDPDRTTLDSVITTISCPSDQWAQPLTDRERALLDRACPVLSCELWASLINSIKDSGTYPPEWGSSPGQFRAPGTASSTACA